MYYQWHSMKIFPASNEIPLYLVLRRHFTLKANEKAFSPWMKVLCYPRFYSRPRLKPISASGLFCPIKGLQQNAALWKTAFTLHNYNASCARCLSSGAKELVRPIFEAQSACYRPVHFILKCSASTTDAGENKWRYITIKYPMCMSYLDWRDCTVLRPLNNSFWLPYVLPPSKDPDKWSPK